MSREIYAEVRNIFVNELKRDLYGPGYDEIDIITEPSSQAYLTGVLYPQEVEEKIDIEELTDIYIIDEAIQVENEESEYNEQKENINENLVLNKRQSSLGLKCYIHNSVKKIHILA